MHQIHQSSLFVATRYFLPLATFATFYEWVAVAEVAVAEVAVAEVAVAEVAVAEVAVAEVAVAEVAVTVAEVAVAEVVVAFKPLLMTHVTHMKETQIRFFCIHNIRTLDGNNFSSTQ